MAALELFPGRVPIGYANGAPVLASPEFLRALAEVFNRIGGASSVTITDLIVADDDDGGLEEWKAEGAKALDALAMRPAALFEPFTDPLHPLAQQHSEVQALQTEIGGLREEVARLRQEINDLQQGPK